MKAEQYINVTVMSLIVAAKCAHTLHCGLKMAISTVSLIKKEQIETIVQN